MHGRTMYLYMLASCSILDCKAQKDRNSAAVVLAGNTRHQFTLSRVQHIYWIPLWYPLRDEGGQDPTQLIQ